MGRPQKVGGEQVDGGGDPALWEGHPALGKGRGNPGRAGDPEEARPSPKPSGASQGNV